MHAIMHHLNDRKNAGKTKHEGKPVISSLRCKQKKSRLANEHSKADPWPPRSSSLIASAAYFVGSKSIMSGLKNAFNGKVPMADAYRWTTAQVSSL